MDSNLGQVTASGQGAFIPSGYVPVPCVDCGAPCFYYDEDHMKTGAPIEARYGRLLDGSAPEDRTALPRCQACGGRPNLNLNWS